MKNPQRQEIWIVEFEPQRGSEIGKSRPAIVISVPEVGHLPTTDWKNEFANYSWFVQLTPSRENGLTKVSGADGFQCKSFSLDRFVRKIGAITEQELKEIIEAVALCIGL